MNKKINVIVFPCGAENALEIHLALKDVVNINLIGASGKEDHGVFVFKNYIGNLPYIGDSTFIERLNVVIDENDIDIIIPTHDDVVLYLAQNTSKINAKIAVPGLEQAIICRSKRKTYDFFKNESFCPIIFYELNDIKRYPVFSKPDIGQGAKGVKLIDEINKFEIDNDFLKDNVISEFLPGDEITVDCFSDKNNELRFIGPRKRERIFSGISVKSSTIELTNEIESIAVIINAKMKMNGLWYFQLKKDNQGFYKLLEISVRAAGTMNLYRGLGINFPLLTVYNLMGYDVQLIRNNYFLEVDRALFNRYRHNLEYDIIYLDFDDTVTKNNQVNPFVMMFIYNAINNNKKIKLITKHEKNLKETLAKVSINENLFDELIHIKPSDKKFKYIVEKEKVIFIDNAFVERAEVKKHLNIPVFDVDAIATLINWKE
jgi:hypothetical protein